MAYQLMGFLKKILMTSLMRSFLNLNWMIEQEMLLMTTENSNFHMPRIMLLKIRCKEVLKNIFFLKIYDFRDADVKIQN